MQYLLQKYSIFFSRADVLSAFVPDNYVAYNLRISSVKIHETAAVSIVHNRYPCIVINLNKHFRKTSHAYLNVAFSSQVDIAYRKVIIDKFPAAIPVENQRLCLVTQSVHAFIHIDAVLVKFAPAGILHKVIVTRKVVFDDEVYPPDVFVEEVGHTCVIRPSVIPLVTKSETAGF